MHIQDSKSGKSISTLSQLRELGTKNKFAVFGLVVVLFSFAGIPPLAGFFPKFLILFNLVGISSYPAVIAGCLSSCVSAYYYIRLIKILLFYRNLPIEFKPRYNMVFIYAYGVDRLIKFALFLIIIFPFYFNFLTNSLYTILESSCVVYTGLSLF